MRNRAKDKTRSGQTHIEEKSIDVSMELRIYLRKAAQETYEKMAILEIT